MLLQNIILTGIYYLIVQKLVILFYINGRNSLSTDDIADIEWALKELSQTLEKIKNNSNYSHEH